jgi:hypothetical protein
VAGVAAGAGIHRRHQRERGGELDGGAGARYANDAFFQRLAQGLQRAAPELRQLVEEQHAVVGERDVAGPGVAAAAHQGGIRRRVVRRTEGPVDQQPAAGAERAGNGVDGRDLERLVEAERRQDAGQAPRQHGLAGARRADEQQVMAAGRGDLERAPGRGLAADVGEVEPVVSGRRGGRGGARPRLGGLLQAGHRVGERADGHDVQRIDDRRLAGVRLGQQHGGHALAAQPDGHREHAARRQDLAVERQLADHRDPRPPGPRRHARRGEDAERDRQVERRAGLAHVGRRQVDRDAMAGELEAGVADRGADPVAALAHGRVGQPDHGEHRQAERDVDLDRDGERLDAAERRTLHLRQHAGGVRSKDDASACQRIRR